MGHRNYKVGEVAHIYRRSADGIILFYTPIDYLVMFIIVSVAARKYSIVVLGFCPMVDHLHLLIRAQSQKSVSDFVRDITSQYAKSLNETAQETGPVFSDEFGLANKTSEKAVRTSINYVYNNPVEKKLCGTAEQWKWNFLSYGRSDHPFSPKLTLNRAPSKLRKAVRYVKHEADLGRRISHRRLSAIFEGLDEVQSKQLVDRIVTSYNFIDYGELLKYYKSFDAMLLAMASNTGGEYDIVEEFNCYSDSAYFKMTDLLKKYGIVGTDRILTMSPASRNLYASCFVRSEIAVKFQIRKYFHLSKKGR